VDEGVKEYKTYAEHEERLEGRGFANMTRVRAHMLLEYRGVGRDWLNQELVSPYGRGIRFQNSIRYRAAPDSPASDTLFNGWSDVRRKRTQVFPREVATRLRRTLRPQGFRKRHGIRGSFRTGL